MLISYLIGCFSNVRNSKGKSGNLRISYEKGQASVKYIDSESGDIKECFTIPVELPKGGHVLISASSSLESP